MIVQETTQDALPDSSKTDGGVVTEKADSEMAEGDINSGKVASVMDDGQTHSEKADSGMDDDSQHSHESNTQQSVGTSNDSEDDDDDVVVRRPPKIKNVFNSDIFDAEEDSDDDDNTTPKDDRGSENNDKTEHRDSDDSENEDKSTQRDSGDESASDSDKSNNDSDEGFNENDIDPKLLKKLKKGASKKPTSQRRAAQESLMAIHSETQRIVRESRVNLPYHQPEPKPLSAFLERASKKRESYRTVLHSRDIHKAKAMQDVFEKTRLQAKSQKAPAIVVPEEKRKDEDCDDEKTESLSKCTCPQEAESKSDLLSQDDLPDIGSEVQSCEMSKTTCKKCTKERDNLCEPTSSKTSDDDMEVQTEEQNVSKECEESESNTQSNIDSSTSAISKETPVSEPYSALSDDESETEIRNKNEEGEISSAKNDSEHSQIENHKDNESVDTDKNNAENEGSLLRLKKSLLLAKLPELSAPPMLSGGPDTFIDFDTDSSDMKYVKPGVNKLMDRFMKHSQKKKKHTPKDVDISIIEKEKSGEHEELKMKSFTYHPTEEDENSLSQLDAPGAKLTALKEKLKVSMKKRREEARKQRQDMYDLDNEEGGYSDGEDTEKILDDDAEMSDKSDTDVEDEEYDEQFEDYEEEGEEEEKENNPFADDEAEESDNDKPEDDKEDNDEEDDEMELRMQLSDDDDENEDSNIIVPKSKRLQLSAKKKCRALQISDDEEDSKEASRHASSKAQEEEEEAKEESASNRKEASRGKVEEEGTGVEFEGRRLSESMDNDEDDFIPFSKHLSSAQYPARRKSSSLVLPIENSQDLYGSTQSLAQLPLDTQKESQSFNFSLEESQSQMLDADGFLKVGSTAKKSNKPLNFGSCNIPDTQDNMDELLGLCSGRFAGEGGEKKAVKNLFGQGTQVTQDNMGELLGLCSGKFTDSVSQDESSRGSGKKRKLSEDDDAESNLSLQLESDDEAKSTKDALSDDDEDDAQKDSEDEDPEEDDQNSRGADLEQKKFKGFTVGNKHGKIRKDFVEQEAELSGSEYDSDENLDLAEDEDVLEMEEGDKDAVGTEEELRNQVGRAHLKQVIDDDKKQLLRFQEMYLPDGDLHSEGGGRVRRFAWSGVDDNTMQDMFDNDSDAENQEEEEQDAAWRKDRFEREKFLQEQQENELQDSEDSQFLKLGKVFLKRRDSDTGSNKKVPTPVQIPTVKATTKATGTLTSGLKLTTSRRGSFLSRDKNTLAKIAETTKAAVNPNGVKNSRNFVFQVISPDKDSDSQAMPAPKGTKIRKALKPRTDQPAAKKQRLEKDFSFSQHSIFQHL